ncbi:hypothetical protein ACT80S_05390 [Ramlibacter sp. MAHUQ-53]|uniref:hypothetical protein n=1 Tax=unclassified Ramlibacter TaxID=2617605 RepID=UPI003636B09E
MGPFRFRRVPCLLALSALLGGALEAAAEPAPQGVLADCGGTLAPPDPWSAREAAIAAYARVPPACLRSLVRACSEAAAASFLDGGTAAVCSVRYEALLRHGFGGDFRALLAWWHEGR